MFYEHVVARDFAHYEWDWPNTIDAGGTDGPIIPDLLEITKSYDEATNENRVWQLIFGIKGQVMLYLELPADVHRHGLPKIPKPRTENRRVSHFEEWMSPYLEPHFITEHFLMRPDLDRINFDVYNPNDQDNTNLRLRFFVNKLVTERVGTVEGYVKKPTADRWTETLDRLYRRLIPVRPITLYPVTAPAEAHH